MPHPQTPLEIPPAEMSSNSAYPLAWAAEQHVGKRLLGEIIKLRATAAGRIFGQDSRKNKRFPPATRAVEDGYRVNATNSVVPDFADQR